MLLNQIAMAQAFLFRMESQGYACRIHFWWSAFLILVFAPLSIAATQPRQVLLLQPFEHQFAPFNSFAESFRAELMRQSSEPVNVFEISMQPLRFNERPDEEYIVDYFRSMLAGHQLDLVVSLGGPAASFAQKYRKELFPTTPLIMAAIDQRFLQSIIVTSDDTAEVTMIL